MDENESEPLTMQLVRDGVESEAAYQAATELEKTRLEAERQKVANRGLAQTVAQENDVAKILETVIEAASNVVLTAYQAGQQPQVVRQPKPPEKAPERRAENESETDVNRSPVRDEMEDIGLRDED